MTRRNLLWSLGAGYWGAPNPASAAEVARSEKVVWVGDTRVRLIVAEVSMQSRHAFIYFHPHEDEHGSAVVTRHIIRQFGGRFVEIRSEGDRVIRFRLKGASYSFDPNRMFTDAGLESSLAHFAPISKAPMDCARNLRHAVISELGGGKRPIIGVHNNAPDGTSVFYYQNNGMYAAQAAKVAVNPKQNPHDFFVVLDASVFSRLQHGGFNVVLQSTNPTDDGSLSYFCAQHRWSFVSVEAADNDMMQQQRMLEALPAAIG